MTLLWAAMHFQAVLIEQEFRNSDLGISEFRVKWVAAVDLWGKMSGHRVGRCGEKYIVLVHMYDQVTCCQVSFHLSLDCIYYLRMRCVHPTVCVQL